MKDLAGIDVGLSFIEATTGVCRIGAAEFLVAHTFADFISRREELASQGSFELIAIDAPLLPQGQMEIERRICERIFVLGAFSARCKPGETHH
jgi:hypothetical protein